MSLSFEILVNYSIYGIVNAPYCIILTWIPALDIHHLKLTRHPYHPQNVFYNPTFDIFTHLT